MATTHGPHLNTSPLVVQGLVQMLFQTTLTFVVFRQLVVSIRTHQRVPAVWNVSATTELPNTTENVAAPASGGSIPWTQLAKLFTQLWEMHDMTRVCETTHTRINLAALGLIHFSTRTFLVGGDGEPNYPLCEQVWTLPTLSPAPLTPGFSSGFNSHILGATDLFIDNTLLEAITKIQASDATFYV